MTALFTIGIVAAVFFIVPPAEGLGNLVRIMYFHVPTAWLSVIAFFTSAYFAARYLRRNDLSSDALSARAVKIGFVCVLLSTISGAIFSKLTWGAYWNWDPRQTTIFVLILIYGAYLTLRAAVNDRRTRAKVSAIYSLLSVLTVPFLVSNDEEVDSDEQKNIIGRADSAVRRIRGADVERIGDAVRVDSGGGGVALDGASQGIARRKIARARSGRQ